MKRRRWLLRMWTLWSPELSCVLQTTTMKERNAERHGLTIWPAGKTNKLAEALNLILIAIPSARPTPQLPRAGLVMPSRARELLLSPRAIRAIRNRVNLAEDVGQHIAILYASRT